MVDIFLSYSEKDREAARRIAELLESAGWSVWWDRRIPAGDNWRKNLDRALQTMNCMVVLWSGSSVQSEWVCEEASEGHRLNKLVPVLIERVRPPAGFREIQAADLAAWDGSRDFPAVQELLRDLAGRLGNSATAGETAVESEQVGGESRGVVTAAIEDREPVVSQATDHVGDGRPSANSPPAEDKPAEYQHVPYSPPAQVKLADPGPGEFLRRVAPWLLAGALALASIAIFLPFGKQERGDSGTATSTTSANSPPAQAKLADQVATIPGARPPPPATATEPPAPSTVAPTTSPPSGVAAASKSIQSPPSRPKDVKAESKSNTRVSSAKINPRCSDILQELQLGGALSDEERTFLQKECK